MKTEIYKITDPTKFVGTIIGCARNGATPSGHILSVATTKGDRTILWLPDGRKQEDQGPGPRAEQIVSENYLQV